MNKENDKKLMIFDVFIDTQSQSKNVGISRTEFWTFVLKSVPLLSVTPSTLVVFEYIIVNNICSVVGTTLHHDEINVE